MTSKRIKGITIEIDGDTTKLTKALQNVDSQLYKSQGKLKDLNRLLKLDPKNTELLTQKQKALTKSIDDTKERLKQLKAASEQAAKAQDFPQDKYDALQREIAETEQDLKKLEKEMKKFGSVAKQKLAAVGESFKAFGKKIGNIGTTLTTKVTVPIVAGFTAATKGALDFEDGLAKAYTIADESVVSIDEMRQGLLDLSNDSGKSVGDLTESLYQALSASVDTGDALDFVRRATNLAKAGFLDTAGSVDVLTTIINAYGYSAKDAEKISDELVKTQNDGKTSVNELAQSLGNVIPTASALHVPLEQLTAAYVSTTKQGINTANSTTYINSMLNELSKGGSKASKILYEKTGKSFGELEKSGYTLGDILGILYDEVGGNSEAFSNLWGNVRAGKGALAIVNGGIAEYNEEVTAMENSTGTVEQALIKLQTPTVDLKNAINKLVNAGIEIGDRFAPYVSKAAEAITELVEKWDNLDQSTKDFIAKIALVVAAVGPVLVVVGKLSTGIGVILPLIGSIGSVLVGTVIPAIGSVLVAIAPALPVIIAIAAAIAAVIVIVKNWDKITKWFSEQWKKFTKIISDTTENMKKWVTDKWNALKTAVGNTITAIKTGAVEKWNALKNTVITTVENLKTGALNKWNSLKTSIIDGVTRMKDTVTGKLDSIRQAFSDKLTAAKNTVQGIIDKIKGIFNFSWSLPAPKLPHFRISWQSYGPFSLPSFDGIDWYRKAYDNPMLFTSPTVLATNGGLKGFGDGPGAEVVMGLNKLRDLVGGGETTYAPVFNIYAQPGQNIDQLARAVEQRFTRWQRQRETAKV